MISAVLWVFTASPVFLVTLLVVTLLVAQVVSWVLLWVYRRSVEILVTLLVALTVSWVIVVLNVGEDFSGSGPPTILATPSVTAAAARTPTEAPSTPISEERDLTIYKKDTVMVGEQIVIEVVLTGPNVQASAPPFPGVYAIVKVNTPSGKQFRIFFAPPEPTLLTLNVSALNFATAYNPGETQEIFRDTPFLEWTVSLAPKQGAVGRQDITLTLSQSLPSGEGTPQGINTEYKSQFVIQIEPAEKPGENKIIRMLKWALPNGPLPFLTWVVAFLTLIVALFGRRRILASFTFGRRRFRAWFIFRRRRIRAWFRSRSR